MSNTSKTALGGMAVALSVVILLPSAIDIMSLALPAIAGLIVLFCVIELDKKWAFGVYFATSLIGAVVLPNKEAIVYYIAYFGYYPIVKALIENKNMNRFFEYAVKLLLFNASFALSILFLIKVMGIPFDEMFDIDRTKWWADLVIPIFVLVGNIFFFIYDILFLRIFATVYINNWQKKMKKLFRFK